ncbi:MAG: hypothetical protein L6V82_07955 [Clostridiales bacterium]|nr:MAG: hypothetical protein L6V82_07955 [Clostridiales bacterium]
MLNKCNVLTWEKPWWQPNFPFILFLIGYVPFYVAAVVIHDLPRKWQLIGLGAILFVVVLLLIISGSLGMLSHQTDGHGNWIGNSAMATTELSERYFAYKSSFFTR